MTSQLYACAHCHAERRLPESPVDGPQSVRCGCETCGTIRTHLAIGRVEWVTRVARG